MDVREEGMAILGVGEEFIGLLKDGDGVLRLPERVEEDWTEEKAVSGRLFSGFEFKILDEGMMLREVL